tara:strand:- start:24432 stop:25265 length:834 start_codon:yes stop_codon:yes gene_type:complete
MTVQRHYLVLADGQQLHYLRGGAGPTVLLLHPSPLHAEFMRPLAERLCPDFDVVAMDAPGYGRSDPLLSDAEGLLPYVEVIAEFISRLDLERVQIYGNATGAQLAIEAAKALPQRVSALVLDNAGCFTSDEQESLLADYFPDISVQPDGSHLSLVWRMATQLYEYFPWYDTRESARISAQPAPPELVQATVLAYLAAGPQYARAYRAAFANERPEQLAAVQQPVNVLLWQDSILLHYSRRLQTAELPSTVRFTDVPSGVDARYAAVGRAFIKHEKAR